MLHRVILFFDSTSLWFHKVGTIFFVPAMAFLVTLDVILRYLFNAPTIWGKEVTELMLFLALMLSLIYCWDEQRHIRMEILYTRFKGGWRLVADSLCALTGMIVFGFMAVQSVRDIPFMIRTHEIGQESHVPLWPFRVFLALISLMFFFKLLIYLLVPGKRIKAKEGE